MPRVDVKACSIQRNIFTLQSAMDKPRPQKTEEGIQQTKKNKEKRRLGSLQAIEEGQLERVQKSLLFAVSDDQTGNPKKLYSFIKSKKCGASGVSPLTLK